ncbi:Nif3-like dinuclear metal center hexameric protein [Salinibacter altiplanensis]|uniref:Nif3-like dinuclear metal center hexameric protein n=1 Tax=Salinibacter altiplanensis TaxID=1803181 RepID=UPI001F019DD7|nr:Nif3-like dinuclear metal center hexameric protein [Salinibacter altiplanensis]
MDDTPTIADIATALEAWAPPGSAQDYDNVGLQVGDAARGVTRAVLALDATPEVLAEAKAHDAELVVTHHPLLFRPLDGVTADGYVSNLALRFAEAGIGLYSIHTNLDAAPEGVSFALAERLGLTDVGFLDGFADTLYKLAVFVPEDAVDDVRQALADAGAGQIGDYEACAFATEGTGFFAPGADTDPHIGTAGGNVESADERKLEVEVARWALGPVKAALQEAHPYEEMAYDLYPVKQKNSQAGLGALGHLDDPLPLSAFLDRVATRLDAGSLRYVGDPDATVERAAVCGGAGSDFIGTARGAGADAYVTADVTYHEFFDVLGTDGAPEMALIDPGHYETEALTEALLRDRLREHFPRVDWHRTDTTTSPMRTFVPSGDAGDEPS